ncbi:MAG: electron transfer flavoprotein subunit alpha/FixB family protein [Gammaproteobacteria bacterium]
MAVLVVAEHDNSSLHPNSLAAVTAASAIGGDVHLLVAGSDCAAVASAAASVAGVAEVLHADHASLGDALAENLAAVVTALTGDYSHVLTPASTYGKNFLPRVAAKLDVMQISDIIQVVSEDTFVRPIYAGNALVTVKSSDATKLITVRGTAFDGAPAEGGSAPIREIGFESAHPAVAFESRAVTISERPDLTTSKIVVSGGRGMGSKENFAIIEALAGKLNAAVGASRAAVDSGFAPNDHQVGQTGKVVAPDLYIAVGISGAIQHQAGMKDSKTIVAINKDEEAPIFQIADYGIVADLFDVVPELTEKL